VADVLSAARAAGIGLSVFLVLLSTVTIAIVAFTAVPPTAVLQIMFGSVGLRLAGRAVSSLRAS
jgi:hypothetical protein